MQLACVSYFSVKPFLHSVLLGVLLSLGITVCASEAREFHCAVYDDVGAGASKHDLLRALRNTNGVYIQRLTGEDFRTRDLSKFDVVICPGGSGSKQGRQLGEQGRERIRAFVKAGGAFIGICAGAYLASADYDWSLNVLDARVLDRKHWARGTGMVQLEICSTGLEIFDAEKEITIFYGQGPLLAPADKPDIPDFESLAVYKTEINKNGAPKGIMLDTTAIALGEYGKGRVLCFSPHPEKTKGLEHMVAQALEHIGGPKNSALPASLSDSISISRLTPDVSQKNMPNGNYCAPCAVTNLLFQFDAQSKLENALSDSRASHNRNAKVLGNEQFERLVASELGADEYMQTKTKNGTNRYRLVNGMHRWLAQNAENVVLQVGYTGLRLYDKKSVDKEVRGRLEAITGTPTPNHILKALHRKQGVAILFGSYREDDSGQLQRLGGHYVSVVGMNTEAGETVIVLHDSNDGFEGPKHVIANPIDKKLQLYSEGELLAEGIGLVELINAPIRKDGRRAFLETVFQFDVVPKNN